MTLKIDHYNRFSQYGCPISELGIAGGVHRELSIERPRRSNTHPLDTRVVGTGGRLYIAARSPYKYVTVT